MHGMGGMMDGAYACKGKRGFRSCRAVACMPPSGRVSVWDSLELDISTNSA
jgi:hypothetical protein